MWGDWHLACTSPLSPRGRERGRSGDPASPVPWASGPPRPLAGDPREAGLEQGSSPSRMLRWACPNITDGHHSPRKQVGSFIQWYESLDKYPVTVVDRKAAGPGSSSSRDLKKYEGRAVHITPGTRNPPRTQCLSPSAESNGRGCDGGCPTRSTTQQQSPARNNSPVYYAE